MTQHNHDSRTSSKQPIFSKHVDGTEKGKRVPASPSRPKGEDRDEWSAYWKAQGQSWRTEPEISQERQEELARCRATPADIEKGIYPFGGKKLDRADVEWLLATHENGRGPVIWSDEKQRDRRGIDLHGADLRSDGNKAVDLRNLPLTRLRGAVTFDEYYAMSEELRIKARIQLKGADLRGAQLEGADLSEAQLEGADLSEAQLEGADLFEAQLEGAYLRGAQLKGADLFEAQLEGADLSEAQLEGAGLIGAQLKGAYLIGAQLKGAYLRGAKLKGANLSEAQLEGAHLSRAQLEGAHLSRAQLEGADLFEAQLEGAHLRGVTLSKEDSIGPFLADVQWGTTNLAVVDWSQVVLLGEEHVARQKNENDEKKTKNRRLEEYQQATRANRQLAVALLGQGLNEDAVRFAYRANALQRKVFWYQLFVTKTRQGRKEPKTRWEMLKKRFVALRQRVQRFSSYIFSLFLDVLAGYGYKPERTVGWYLFMVLGFALAYALFGHLPFWPDALVYSLTSFHGRGFLPNLDGQIVTLHYPLVVMAAFEAVIGLLIEISFIATFTQRFFGK
jgi:uncharacterized protein YjbI with pentapeptide repeats